MKHEHQGVEGYVAWFYLLSNFHRTRGNEFYYGRKKHDLFIYPSIWPKSEGGGVCVGFDFFAFWSSHHVPNVFLNKFSMMFLTCFSCSLCVPQDVPNSTALHTIVFAQRWIFITYEGGPKGGTFFGGIIFKIILWWANWMAPCKNKKKLWV